MGYYLVEVMILMCSVTTTIQQQPRLSPLQSSVQRIRRNTAALSNRHAYHLLVGLGERGCSASKIDYSSFIHCTTPI